jgi:hypothetical protein
LTAVVAGSHSFDSHFRWQQERERTITGLQAGCTINYFIHQLGPPIISKPDGNGYNQDIFKERGYYVDTLTRKTSEVLYYEVLACDPSIRPNFVMPGLGRVVLNVSAFASASQMADYQYSKGGFGLDGGPYMREYLYGTALGSYRTFMWGINASCPQGAPQLDSLLRSIPANPTVNPPSQRQLAEVRSRAIPNEYGVTAPYVFIDELPKIGLGVDEIAVSLGSPFSIPQENRHRSVVPCRLGVGSFNHSPKTCGEP